MKLEDYLVKECGFQYDAEGHLVGHGNIYLEHFNNLRGIDRHKDVRLEIVIGGTIPRTSSTAKSIVAKCTADIMQRWMELGRRRHWSYVR